MAYTPILHLPEVAPNQDQKETTINTSLAILEAAMNDTLSVSLASGNVTLNTDQFTKWFLHQYFGHTAARTVTIPATPRWFAVENLGTGTIVFQASGASSANLTASLLPGKIGLVVTDGQDVRFVVPDPTGGTGTLEDLSNVSGVATNGQLLRYVSADSRWEPWTLALAFSQLTDFPGSYGANASKLLAVRADGLGLEWVDSSANVNSFIDLNDVPNSYSGAANRTVKVNSGGSGLIFAQPKLTEASDFPTSYSGAAAKFLRVNNTPNAVVFDVMTTDDISDGPGSPSSADALKYVRVKTDGSGWEYASGTGGPDHFYQLADVPASYTGQAKKLARVNVAETGLEYHAPVLTDNGDLPSSYAGAGGKFLQVNTGATAVQFGLPKVVDLSDGPGSPGSNGLKVVRANSGGTALEYKLLGFTDLANVPSSYAGQAGKFLKVKSDETGLQFSSSSASVALTDLTDGPGSYSGAANKFVVVNGGATGFIFKSVLVPVNIGDLADVENATSKNQGDYLRWIDGVWQADPGSTGGATSLAQLTDVALSSLVGGDILRYNSTTHKFVNVAMPLIPVNLGDLADVEDGTGTPADGSVLMRRDGVWQAEPLPDSSTVHDFTDLGDVPNDYTAQAGKAIRVNATEDGLEFYDAGSGGGGGATSLGELSDVDLSTGTPNEGDVLTYHDGVWNSEPIPATGTIIKGELVHHYYGSNAAGQSITLGSTPAVGNWLVVVMGSNDFSAATAAGDWTRYDKADDGASYLSVGIYYKKVVTGDTATITPTTNAASVNPYAVYEFKNLSAGFPASFTAHYIATGGTPTPGSFSTTGTAEILVTALQRNTSINLVVGGTTYDFSETSGHANGRDVTSAGVVLENGSLTPTITYDGSGDQRAAVVLQVNLDSGIAGFTSLSDTPPSYVGKSRKAVAVRSDEAGLEFVERTADIGTFIGGIPGNSEMVLRVIAASAFDVPTTGHQGSAETSATASTVFTFKKNGVSFGTATFASSGNTATYSITATAFAAGDVLSISAPASADATLADISLTLHATRH